jgi:hypothetical protein
VEFESSFRVSVVNVWNVWFDFYCIIYLSITYIFGITQKLYIFGITHTNLFRYTYGYSAISRQDIWY